MSSFRKKGRPLSREEQTYADDTLLIVACEDRYAPEQYFKMLPNQRVKVLTLPTLDDRSSPKAVLDRLHQFEKGADPLIPLKIEGFRANIARFRDLFKIS